MTNNDILNFLNDKFPENDACSWDNCGLLLGSREKLIKNIMVCLDITQLILDEAIREDVDLIITHHPVIFNSIKLINKDDLVYKLIENNIDVISYHTNLDVAMEGVNFQLCKIFNVKNIRTLSHSHKEADIIRYGEISPIKSVDFLKEVKQKLNCLCLKSSNSNKIIKTVAFCGGSGSGFVPLIKKHNIDAYITSEIKHDKFIYANENDILIIDAGHYETENIVVKYLEEILEQNFKNIKLIRSKGNINPVIYTL